jgi:dihydrolipoamide dehydrogenase
MTEHADIAIIGAGPGGYATALRAAQLGKTVALIERDAVVGGTCLNRGCIPSKALITASRQVQTIRSAQEIGIHATIDSVDYGTMRNYKLRMVDTMTKGLSGLLAHRGVRVYRAIATLDDVSEHTLTLRESVPGLGVQLFLKAGVAQPLPATLTLSAEHIVLATGSEPLALPYHDFSGALIDSTQALNLNHAPSSAIIIGSGAIAAEFASMWNAAGCEVTMLIRKDRLLSFWDKRTGMTLTRELKRSGVNVITRTAISSVDVGVNLGATVHYTKQGGNEELSAFAEIALGAIGRKPLTDAPWFDDNDIQRDTQGYVTTDEYGQTSIPGLWAVGDITPGPALAYRAFQQGIVIAESISGIDTQPVRDSTIAQVVFSSPEAATVGYTLEQARANTTLHNVKETPYPMMANSRMLMSESAGSLSIVSGEYEDDPGEPVVLGAHIVAPSASDLITEAAQLVANRISVHHASNLIHPHPTFSEMLGETLLKADGRPLHTL